MKVYLAGPMTHVPQFNIPAFDAAAKDLRVVGHEVVSPAELDDPETRAISLASPDGNPDTLTSHGKTWGQFLARDVQLIADGGIEVVYVLPGWGDSRGARLETFVAKAMCGLPIFEYDGDSPYGKKGEVAAITLVMAWAGGNLWGDVRNVITGRVYDGLVSAGYSL